MTRSAPRNILFEEKSTSKDALESILDQRSSSPEVKRVYNRKKRRTTIVDSKTTEPFIERPSSSTTVKKGSRKSSEKAKQKEPEEHVCRIPHIRLTNKYEIKCKINCRTFFIEHIPCYRG
jgi:hypothetical protein